MPLSFLLESEVSNPKEYLEVRVVSSECLYPRPPLRTHDSCPASFSLPISSTSRVSSVVNKPTRRRPTLPPETLLCHAFGPSALERLKRATENSSESTSSSTSSCSFSSSPISSLSSPTSDRPSLVPKKTSLSYKHDHFPKTPPPGTFRSVPKRSKRPSTHSIEEDNCVSDSLASFSEDSDSQEREPLMSAALWQKKMEERVERRKQHRSLRRDKSLSRIPLEFDDFELPTPFHLPPMIDIPRSPPPKRVDSRKIDIHIQLNVLDEKVEPAYKEGFTTNEIEIKDEEKEIDASSEKNSTDIEELVKQVSSVELTAW